MEITNEQIKKEFERQVNLCAGIGRDAMLSIIEDVLPQKVLATERNTIMKINVDEITEIESQLEMRRPSTLNITVSLSEGQAQKLFYQLWEFYGDEYLNKWLSQEAYAELKELNSDKNPERSVVA